MILPVRLISKEEITDPIDLFGCREPLRLERMFLPDMILYSDHIECQECKLSLPKTREAMDAHACEKSDPVNHPPHYTRGKIECIDVIEDWKLDFHRAQVLKYVCRAGHKDPATEIEDLKKARWYLDRLISKKESS